MGLYPKMQITVLKLITWIQMPWNGSCTMKDRMTWQSNYWRNDKTLNQVKQNITYPLSCNIINYHFIAHSLCRHENNAIRTMFSPFCLLFLPSFARKCFCIDPSLFIFHHCFIATKSQNLLISSLFLCLSFSFPHNFQTTKSTLNEISALQWCGMSG